SAGCGAMFGRDRGEKTGQGGAFRQLGLRKGAVFVVVNALGRILDREGRVGRGNLDPQTGERNNPVAASADPAEQSQMPSAPAGNTTLTVIITNQQLSKRDREQWAKQVHSSMSRAVYPFHTLMDGDTLFAVTTNEVANPSLEVAALGVVTGELVWDAILA